jgi:glutaminase
MSVRRAHAKHVLVAFIVAASCASDTLPAWRQHSNSLASSPQQIEVAISEAYAKFRGDTSGSNANSMPCLAQVDPKLFAVAVVTTDNQVFTLGDVDHQFSIQSISNVFTLALAMAQKGPGKVIRRIPNEAAGRRLESVMSDVEMSPRPGDPLANAVAITLTSLVSGRNAADRWDRILDFYSKAAGEKLALMNDVYRSETSNNTRHKAIAMLLARNGRIYSDPFDSVDIYARECAVGVNAEQLALMGATISNNGVNPRTGEQVIKPQNLPYILSAMQMPGFTDPYVEWTWEGGISAQSAISGGILAVAPGKGAVVVFAPRLDRDGNSVKARKTIEYVVKKLNLEASSAGTIGVKR